MSSNAEIERKLAADRARQRKAGAQTSEQLTIAVLQIVNTFLQDVAEDPKRLDRAIELSNKQIKEAINGRQES